MTVRRRVQSLGWIAKARLSMGGRLGKLAARFSLTFVLVASGFTILLAQQASATTWTVSCPSQNLQTVINEAASGDTINVSGTCTGNFTTPLGVSLSIIGPATLDGNHTGTVLTTNGPVTLQYLTIQNGNGPAGANGDGGVNVSNGSPGLAGGILSFGPLTVLNSTIQANAGGKGGDGGSNPTEADDGGQGGAGGIESFAPLTVTSSTIASNVGGAGGNTTCSEGVSSDDCGVPGTGGAGGTSASYSALATSAALTMTDSTVEGNDGGAGGGIPGTDGFGTAFGGAGGLSVITSGTYPSSLYNSDVVANVAWTWTGRDFSDAPQALMTNSIGGVDIQGGQVGFHNSTISSNTGTGIFSESGTSAYLIYTTVASNSEGGLLGITLGTSTVTASVLVGNASAYLSGEDDCVYNTPAFSATDGVPAGTPPTSGGFNVADLCLLASGGLSSDTFNWSASSVLDSLANNGGPTQTQALVVPSSPAIDIVPIGSLAPTGLPLCPTDGSLTDQRGVVRPQGLGCDAGAYESNLSQTITPLNGGMPNPVFVGGSTTLAASASSGLPVVFGVDPTTTTGACTVSGSTVTYTGRGYCAVDYSQPGGSGYSAAPEIVVNTNVFQRQNIRFTSTPPSDPPVGAHYTVAATGGGSGNPVTFTIATASKAVCSVSGATVSFIGNGVCTIDANQAAGAAGTYYTAAAQVQQSITVGFSIDTPFLPGGTRGMPYSQALHTLGGVGPFTWSSGALPGGLTFKNGVLSGTPDYGNSLGSVPITFTATDSAKPTAHKATVTLDLVIIPGLYVSDINNNQVDEVVPSDGQTRTVVSGLNAPNGLALDDAGNLYVSESGANEVEKITPAGVKSAYLTGLNAPSRIVLDPAGDLYVADTGHNRIVEKTVGGTVKVIASSIPSPVGVALDKSSNLYVTESTANQVIKITPSGTVVPITATLNTPNGITLNSAGDLFIADWGDSTLWGIAPNGNQYSYPITGLNHPNDVAIDLVSGQVFVADHDTGKVISWMPTAHGSTQRTVPAKGLSGPNAIAFH